MRPRVPRSDPAATAPASRASTTAVVNPVVPTTTSPSAASDGSARSAVRQPAASARADGRLDRVGGIGPSERGPQQHRRREDRPDRVRDVAAGDVRRRAVDRLVQAELAVFGPALPERRGRQDAEAPGEDRRLVGQDVAEQVLGDDDVEVGRPADEQHRARVDELVVEPHVRVLDRDLVRHPAPQPRGREHVGLVDRGDDAAPAARQLEREADDPGDLVFGVGQRVERGPGARLGRRLGPVAEVDPAGQLADDDHVDPGEQLGAERRRPDEGRLDGDRAQVGVQAEPAAQREERLLRPDRGARVGPLRTADRAEQDRVGLAAGRQVLVADGDPERIDRGAADDVLRPVDREAEPRRRRHRRRAAPPRRPPARPRRPGSSRSGTSSWRRRSRERLALARRDERDRDPVDLGAVELVDRHEVALERRLDDVGG